MKPAPMKVRSPSRHVQSLAQELGGHDPEVKLTIRVRDSMRAQLKAIAAQRRTSVQQLIIDALEQLHPELVDSADGKR